MTRNQKIGIGVGVGVLVIGIILVVINRIGRNDVPQETPNPTPTTTENTTPTPTPPPAEQPTPTTQPVDVSQQSEQAQVLRLARIVIERYGSFSNRNNFENIRSLEPFMTEAFVQESLRFIDSNQDEDAASEFYGVSTTAAALELTGFTEGVSAQVTVQTRRVETKSNAENTQFNQEAVLDFENVEGVWKVSDITWK